MFCPKCGATLKDGAKFCHSCGFNMVENPVNPQPQPQQQQNPFQNFNQANAQAAASNIFTRATNIMFKTKAEWQAIELETPNTTSILTGYVLPLALIPAIFSILGYGLVGISVPFWGRFTSWNMGISAGITSFISTILAVYITAFIVDALAPSFKAQKNFGRAMQLVAYSFTPMWVAGVFSIFPNVAWLGSLLGLYGLFLMYQGFEHTMKPAKESTVGYFLATLGILIVVYIILALILGMILGAIFISSSYGSYRYGY
jgi:hypothetical protein